MTNLIERLRIGQNAGSRVCEEAADEIERLTAERDRFHDDYRIQNDHIIKLTDEIRLQSERIAKLEEIEAVALDAFYFHGYHEGACMCVDCRLAMILKENSDSYKQDQAIVKALTPVSDSQECDQCGGTGMLCEDGSESFCPYCDSTGAADNQRRFHEFRAYRDDPDICSICLRIKDSPVHTVVATKQDTADG